MIHGIPLVHFEAPSHSQQFVRIRRVAATLGAWAVLILSLPLTLALALLIRVSSAGPMLFVQERIGVNRKPFRMYKFRTMYDRAEELQAQVEEFNESGAGLFKIRRDPRITPVGRFLRRFSLDELPQLINVIRGEMALVGPRPLPRRDFENYYEDWHYGRHAGMPGLTCLWQVSGRSDLDFHNMCILDVYYLRNRNWILDLKILLKTFWVVLFAKGAY
jgi:lipopolysaccharide/colanic/teichoic acid biosynthesis glycosyltransferase